MPAKGLYVPVPASEYSLFTGEPLDNPTSAKSAERKTGKLEDEFTMAPFSVWSARDGRWRDRKRAWMDLGIRSEVGRGGKLTYQINRDGTWDGKVPPGANDPQGVTFAASAQPKEVYNAKNEYERQLGRTVTWDEFYAEFPDAASTGGTSVFDPVVCELAYRWFSPVGGHVLDPFAGGSVRGIVAAKLGRQYTGIELAETQVNANEDQRELVADVPAALQPRWICDDSRNIDARSDLPPADMIFSCPPYGDLEVYSDDPRDISTLDYPAFMTAYRTIIAAACRRLCHNRFAVFTVGDFRDADGCYRNFVGDTVSAFRAAGLRFYNEAILVTSVASLAVRVGAQFRGSRKLGKTHQNVLVFVKGDPEIATAACGPVCAE